METDTASRGAHWCSMAFVGRIPLVVGHIVGTRPDLLLTCRLTERPPMYHRAPRERSASQNKALCDESTPTAPQALMIHTQGPNHISPRGRSRLKTSLGSNGMISRALCRHTISLIIIASEVRGMTYIESIMELAERPLGCHQGTAEVSLVVPDWLVPLISTLLLWIYSKYRSYIATSV
jgi:hypothetical protein